MAFKEAIKNYLDKLAKEDKLFAETYKNSNKNLDECCDFIKNEAQKKARNGCAVLGDEEVYNLAVHYYDEDAITAKPNSADVAVKSDKKKAKPKAKAQKVETKADSDFDWDEYKIDIPVF